MASLHIIKQWLAWLIGCGKQIILGMDPFIGDNYSFRLSGPLIQHLNNQHIYSLAQVASTNDAGNNQSWIESIHLGLIGELATKWSNFLLLLKSSGISLNNTKDKIVWSWNKEMGTVTANLSYQSIYFTNNTKDIGWWYKSI
jgi:hypothetical protein